jgi:hypothetical protein
MNNHQNPKENPQEIQRQLVEEGAIVGKICPRCNKIRANPEEHCQNCAYISKLIAMLAVQAGAFLGLSAWNDISATDTPDMKTAVETVANTLFKDINIPEK